MSKHLTSFLPKVVAVVANSSSVMNPLTTSMQHELWRQKCGSVIFNDHQQFKPNVLGGFSYKNQNYSIDSFCGVIRTTPSKESKNYIDFFKQYGVPIYNRPKVLKKSSIHNILWQAGLPLSLTYYVSHNQAIPGVKELESMLGFPPYVIKTDHGYGGHGVWKADTHLDACYIVKKKWDEQNVVGSGGGLLIQQFIPSVTLNGQPSCWRVQVLGGKAIGIFHKYSMNGDFKIGNVGKKMELVDIEQAPKSVIRNAEHSAAALGLSLAGIDLLTDKGIVVDVNSLPSFESWYRLGWESETGKTMGDVVVNHALQYFAQQNLPKDNKLGRSR